MKLLTKSLGVLLLLSFTIEAPAQTIAELARKERARQQQVQNQRKGPVITNATAVGGVPSSSVKPTQPAPATTQSTAPATAAPATASTAPATAPATTTPATSAPKPAGPVDNQGRDEKYWRQVFQEARAAAKRADEIVQIQEANVKDLQMQLLRQSDVYNRENVIGPKLTAAQRDLETAKRESEQAKSKISQLENDLRVAGGLPGWAR
jgi:hypothetical protein